jgi:hypothetical protein
MKPVAMLIVLCLWGTTALAAPEKETRPVAPPSPAQISQEIRIILDNAQLQIEALLAEASTSDLQDLELLLEITRLKRESRVLVLQVQLRVAREKQQTENVAKLEEMIDRLTSPPDQQAGSGNPHDKPATVRRGS